MKSPRYVAALLLLSLAAVAADTKKSGGRNKAAPPANPAFANLPDLSDSRPKHVPLGDFTLPDDLEITVWATTPLLSNPIRPGASTSPRA